MDSTNSFNLTGETQRTPLKLRFTHSVLWSIKPHQQPTKQSLRHRLEGILDSVSLTVMKVALLGAAVAVVNTFGISRVANRFSMPVSNSTDQHGCHHNKTSCNPTHYGNPLKNGKPLFCQADEDGLIIDSFVFNPVTGKMIQVAFMWCSPNLTRIGSSVCPNDVPAGANSSGAKAMIAAPGMSQNCFLSCTHDSDCGGGAICADETNQTLNGTVIPAALPANMCSWPA